MGHANGSPVTFVYFNPRNVHSSNSVRPPGLGTPRLRMSSQYSSGVSMSASRVKLGGAGLHDFSLHPPHAVGDQVNLLPGMRR